MMSRALLLAATVALAGQTSPAVDPYLVYLHPTVQDAKGQVLTDLTAADFEVTEGGTPLAVEDARFIAQASALDAGDTVSVIMTRDDERREAGLDGTRLVAIYLDEYHVSPGAPSERARSVVQALLDQLSPRDLAVVVKPLDSLMSIRLTRNRITTAGAVRSFEGRRGVYAPRTLFEKAFIASDPERVEAARAQIATAALAALIDHLDDLNEGRKALVVVTEGFGRGPRRRDGMPTLSGLVRSASRAGVAVYAVDPRALVSPALTAVPDAEKEQEQAARDALRSLADGTGGAALLEPAPVAPLLARITGDSMGYYRLAVRTTPGGSGFRAVQVRSTRAGTVVRGAPGYFGPSASEVARAERLAVASMVADSAPDSAPELPPAREPIFVPTRQVAGPTGLIRAWFGLSAGADDQTNVNFVWEPSLPEAAARNRGEPVNVAIKAASEDGTVVFEGVVGRTDADPQGAASLVFPAPPGRLRVLLAIVDGQSDLMGVEVRDLRVRQSNGPLWLGTPAVLRARSDDELRTIAADPAAAPAATREFSTSERMLVRVSAESNGAPPEVTATIVSKLLRMGWLLPVTPGPSPGQYHIDIPLADLANGEHEVEVMAEGATGRVIETVTIRVSR